MSWKLDNIDFKDYGVGVAKSSGVLDMPKIVDTSTDWLDLNGKDYWQDAADVKYQGREISLNCWIRAAGYAEFKTKVAAFYAALVAPGERSLETAFGNIIERVTVQHGIGMVRKTQYVSSIQVGMFTLRLTVAGDSQSKFIGVYRTDGVLRNVFNYASGAKHSKSLMGDDEVSYTFELNYMADNLNSVGREDFIILDGVKYISYEHPAVAKFASNKYIHECTFRHEFFRTKDVEFRVNGTPNSYLYTDMEGIVDQVIINMNRHYPGLFVKGSIAQTVMFNHQFKDEKCYDMLSKTVQHYGLEFHYAHQPGGSMLINVAEQIGNATGINLGFGKGQGISKVKVRSGNRSDMVTHLYAYGSSKNLPAGYRDNRLCLATQPLFHDNWGMKIEKTMEWPDIFPERTGVVTGYVQRIKPATFVYATGTEGTANPVKIWTHYPDENTYELTDSDMPFDLMERDASGNTVYLIADTSAKIHFNTGDLAGFEFEIADYDHTTKTFKLMPYTDEAGNVYPNETLFPSAENEYKILDINLPDSYIVDAEARLLARAQEFIDIYYQDYGTFDCDIHPSYTGTIDTGDVIYINDADFTSETDPQRVIQIVRDLYNGGSTITISQIKKLSNRNLLEKRLNEIEKVVSSVALASANDQRNSQQTTGEVVNKIIDPEDGKIKVDERVRRRSIDPVMLSPDASTVQFSIKDAVVMNVSGEPNVITVGSGSFYVHNYYAVDRKAIKQIKSME
jgi:hypothetical protein